MSRQTKSLFARKHQSLAKINVSESLASKTTVAAFRERLMLAGGASLEANLERIEELSATANQNPKTERALEYSTRIADKIAAVRDHVRTGNASQAALQALLLAETWMQLRMDTLFASDVHEKARRRARASALSDDDITRAVGRHQTRTAAAAALGITDRQLRNRLRSR